MRVVIADDSVLLREGLALLLADDDHDVVASVATGEELIDAALEHRPDLIISDIRMPPSHTDEGLCAALAIRESWAKAPILLLSQYVVLSYAQDLLTTREGGIGYLLKDRVGDIESFLDACSRVADGGMVLDPDVVSQMMSAGSNQDPIQSLTPREREVLELMAQGHTNAGIAAEMVISEGAVEKHTQRIFAKLGLHGDATVHRRVRAVLTLLGR